MVVSGGERPKRSVADKTRREEWCICKLRCALRMLTDWMEPATRIPASPAGYEGDRQAQQCQGSARWDGGRLSPMPQNGKKGPCGVDHEPRTIMLAQSLMVIIAEKVVLRQGHGLLSRPVWCAEEAV